MSFSIRDAKYSIYLKATRQYYYTDDIKIDGDEYTIYGYWEKQNTKYVYRNVDIILDEYYFGDIIIKKR